MEENKKFLIKCVETNEYLMGNLYFSDEFFSDHDAFRESYFKLKFNRSNEFELINLLGDSISRNEGNLDFSKNRENVLFFSVNFTDLDNIIFYLNIDDKKYALTNYEGKLTYKKRKSKYFSKQIFKIIFEENTKDEENTKEQILEQINFYPLTCRKNICYEGYWETFTNKNRIDDDLIPSNKDDNIFFNEALEDYKKNVSDNFIKNNYKQTFPYPLPTMDFPDKKFIKKLKKLQEKIQNNEIGETNNQCGDSYCRICVKTHIKSIESKFTFKKVKYCFPGGIIHYYENHGVHPSEEFKEAVMNTII